MRRNIRSRPFFAMMVALAVGAGPAAAQSPEAWQSYKYQVPVQKSEASVTPYLQSLAERNAQRKYEIDQALQSYIKLSVPSSEEDHLYAELDDECQDEIINEARFAGFNRDRDIARFLNAVAEVNVALLHPRQVTEDLVAKHAPTADRNALKSSTLSHLLINVIKLFGSTYPKQEADELLKRLNSGRPFDVDKGAAGAFVPIIRSEVYQTRLETSLRPRCEVYRLDGKSDCIVAEVNGRAVFVAHGMSLRFCSTRAEAEQIHKRFDALFANVQNDRSQAALLLQSKADMVSQGKQASWPRPNMMMADVKTEDQSRARNTAAPNPASASDVPSANTSDATGHTPRIVVFDNFGSLTLGMVASGASRVQKLDNSILQQFLSFNQPPEAGRDILDATISSTEYSKWKHHDPADYQPCESNDNAHGMRVLSSILFSLADMKEELQKHGIGIPAPDIWLFPATKEQSVQRFLDELERTISGIEELDYGVGRTIVNISRGDKEDVSRFEQITQVNNIVQRLNNDSQATYLFVTASGQCKHDDDGACIEDVDFNNGCKRIPICLGSRPDFLVTGFAKGERLSPHSFRGGNHVAVATGGNDLVPAGGRDGKVCLGVGSTFAAPKITAASAVLGTVTSIKQASALKSILASMASPLDVNGQNIVFGGDSKAVASGYVNPHDIANLSALIRKQKVESGQLCLSGKDWICGNGLWSTGKLVKLQANDGRIEPINTVRIVGGRDVSELDPFGPHASFVVMQGSLKFVSGKVCQGQRLEVQLRPDVKVDLCNMKGWRLFRLP